MSLFNNPKPVVYAIVVFILIFLGAFVWHEAHGAVLEFEGGNTIVRGSTQVLGLKVVQPGVVSGIGDVGCGFLLIGTSHAPGGVEQQNQVFAHCQVIGNYPTTKWGTFSAGLGVGALQNEDYYNSGRINFSLMLQYKLTRHAGAAYQHISNAGTHSPNDGRDMLLATWRF
jgi:hypothetical protein